MYPEAFIMHNNNNNNNLINVSQGVKQHGCSKKLENKNFQVKQIGKNRKICSKNRKKYEFQQQFHRQHTGSLYPYSLSQSTTLVQRLACEKIFFHWFVHDALWFVNKIWNQTVMLFGLPVKTIFTITPAPTGKKTKTLKLSLTLCGLPIILASHQS